MLLSYLVSQLSHDLQFIWFSGGISLSYDKGNHNSVQKLSKNYDETDVITDKVSMLVKVKYQKRQRSISQCDTADFHRDQLFFLISATFSIVESTDYMADSCYQEQVQSGRD